MERRADIDGLRAIAVVSVVLFHAGVPRITGGFVGVDVFFVISGYLITALILNDIDRDRFSIAYFYERRVRRILPALTAVLLFAFIGTWLIFLPDNARDFGQSMVATVLFSSNILFWKQTGYFDAAAGTKPLLHTWSLAVEEQFYILYPIFLFCISRWMKKRYTAALITVGGLSLALCIWGAKAHLSTTFYLAPARAWELIIGGLLAIQVIPPLRNRRAADALGIVGLALLLYSVATLSELMPFPGTNALYPTIGSALIIYSGTSANSIVRRVLSFKPLVFTGLISYSLYLWHWVVLVLLKYYLIRPLSAWEISGFLLASFVLAVLSWKFVENPFRGSQGLIRSRRRLFAVAAVSSIALGSLGAFMYRTGGMPSRFSPQLASLAAASEDSWHREKLCEGRICRIGDPDAQPGFLLWGDSHVGSIAPVFESMAETNHVSGFIAYKGGCAPLPGLKVYHIDYSGYCDDFNAGVFAFIKAHRIKNVFLHAHWAVYAEGVRFGEQTDKPVLLTPSRNPVDNWPVFASLFRSTVRELRSLPANVTIIAGVPEASMDVPLVLAREAASRASIDPAPRYSDFVRRQERVQKLFSAVSAEDMAPIIDPSRILCNNSRCSVVRGNQVLYQDTQHLTVEGAMTLAPIVGPLLARTQRDTKPDNGVIRGGPPEGVLTDLQKSALDAIAASMPESQRVIVEAGNDDASESWAKGIVNIFAGKGRSVRNDVTIRTESDPALRDVCVLTRDQSGAAYEFAQRISRVIGPPYCSVARDWLRPTELAIVVQKAPGASPTQQIVAR